MKKSVLLVLASASLILAACGKSSTNSSTPKTTSEETTSVSSDTQEEVYVEELSVDVGRLTLEVGDVHELTVSVLPATANQEVTYESDHEDIAYVEDGTVVAAKVGTCTITVKTVGLDQNGEQLTATIDVTVNPEPKELTPISELISAATGTEFATHAYVAGISSGTYDYQPSSGDAIAEYKYVYIADGEDFLQGFNVHAADLNGIAVGDLVEVEGEISQYGSKSTSWITPEFTSKGFTKIEADEDVEEPVFTEWSAEKALGTITDASMNKGYELKEAIVTSISTSGSGHTTVNLQIGEEKATLYLHANSKDNVVEGFSDIKAGWRISGKTWVGANYNQDGFQFVGLNDGVFTEGTLPDQDITPLADVLELDKGATFQSRAKVVSIPDKTETASGNAVWKNVFVADGETFYDLYQVPEAYLDGVKVGDYIEFKGVVANYTDTWTTLEANVSEAVKVLDDASGVADPVFKAWDAEHALGTVAEADVNKGYLITGALIEAVSGSNMTLKIGEESIGVYLRPGSYNLPIDEKAVVGNKLTAKGFMGHNKGAAQFIALGDVSIEEVEYDVESVEVASDAAEIGIGGTYQIEASVLPALADQSLTYTVTSGSDYIEVTDAGLVTGKAAGEGVVTVASAKDPIKTATVTITVTSEVDTSATVTKTSDQLAADNSWANQDKISAFKMGKVSVTLTGNSSNGAKYFTNNGNGQIRIYIDKNGGTGSIALAADEGYTIVSAKFTYVWNVEGSTATFPAATGVADEVNATSKTYTITNPGSGNDQMRISAIEIVYDVVA